MSWGQYLWYCRGKRSTADALKNLQYQPKVITSLLEYIKLCPWKRLYITHDFVQFEDSRVRKEGESTGRAGDVCQISSHGAAWPGTNKVTHKWWFIEWLNTYQYTSYRCHLFQWYDVRTLWLCGARPIADRRTRCTWCVFPCCPVCPCLSWLGGHGPWLPSLEEHSSCEWVDCIAWGVDASSACSNTNKSSPVVPVAHAVSTQNNDMVVHRRRHHHVLMQHPMLSWITPSAQACKTSRLKIGAEFASA